MKRSNPSVLPSQQTTATIARATLASCSFFDFNLASQEEGSALSFAPWLWSLFCQQPLKTLLSRTNWAPSVWWSWTSDCRSICGEHSTVRSSSSCYSMKCWGSIAKNWLTCSRTDCLDLSSLTQSYLQTGTCESTYSLLQHCLSITLRFLKWLVKLGWLYVCNHSQVLTCFNCSFCHDWCQQTC